MQFADIVEAQAFLAQHPDVRSIELFIIDANGVPRGKLLHRDDLLEIYAEGCTLPGSILGMTIRGEEPGECCLPWDMAETDCLAFPLPGSLQLQSWRARPTAQVQVSMHPEHGAPAAQADPRHVLQQAIERLRAIDLHPVMAVELEFYLLDRQRDSEGRPRLLGQDSAAATGMSQAYGVLELEQHQHFLDDLYDACHVQGLPLRTAISEHAPGQLELTLLHRVDALQAVDEGVRYKRVVRGVAARHGLQACFMARPFAAQSGSGLHLHLSLTDAAGNNLFASESPQGSPLLRQAIGGLIETREEAMALFCPHANSFRRFQGNSGVSLARSWGVNNRSLAFRVPGGPAARRHIEHRVCGADANPYLAAAAMLAGVELGIRQQIDPGDPVCGQPPMDADLALPPDWQGALCQLELSDWARESFDAEFLRAFLAIKWQEYREYMTEVGEQDWRWYLRHA